MTRKRGRPTIFTEELAIELCSRIAQGNSVRKVCSAEDMPSIAVVYFWLQSNKDFLAQYTRAKEDSGESDFDKIEEIAERLLDENDELDAQRAKIAMDAYKWTAGRKKPKKYGDKIQQEITGADGGPVQVNQWNLSGVKPNEETN